MIPVTTRLLQRTTPLASRGRHAPQYREQVPQRPHPPIQPLDPPMVPFAAGGTAVWVVVSAVLLLTDAPTSVRWTGVAGVAIGVLLTGLMIIRDRYRARRAR
jgi:hypothetical protein